MEIHDEMTVECPEARVEEVKQILINEMENSVKLKVPIKVEVMVEDFWRQEKYGFEKVTV
jgi:DNA polymerase-1